MFVNVELEEKNYVEDWNKLQQKSLRENKNK
jgi:hypothetical protein